MKSLGRSRLRPGILLLELLMILFCAAYLLPLGIMVLGSFKTSAEAAAFTFNPPQVWQWSNYSTVIEKSQLVRAFLNSVFITGSSVFLCVSSASFCAFTLARRPNRLTGFLYWLCLLGMVAPLQIVTTFALLKGLGLIGNYYGVILVGTAVQIPWSVFFFTSFLKTVPRDIDEAAAIDGATPWVMFTRIILPMLQTVVVTNVVIISISVWNDFMTPLYFLSSREFWTMTLTVYGFFGQYFSDWNLVFANLILTSLPVAVLFLVFQRLVVSGATEGSVKG